MDIPSYQPIYSQLDFESLGFHDCYLHGIRWRYADFSLILDLDYIIQWVKADTTYNFWVAPAELRFQNVDDTKVMLDWAGTAPTSQIRDVFRGESRATPRKVQQVNWQVILSIPEGLIDLWATDFELKIQSVPILHQSPRIR